jgi:hypothetical protein
MRGRTKLTVVASHTMSTKVPHRRVMYPRLTSPSLALQQVLTAAAA